MTLKRITTIILVLLVLAGLLFGVSWYMARRNAEKNGTTPLTFREFLGIGSPAVPGTPVDGELTGEFTDPQRTVKYDTNNNGINDWVEDINNNGIIDGNEDANNNGTLDGDEDYDNNGVPNRDDTYTQIDPTDGGDNGSVTPDDSITDPGGFDDDPFTPEGNNPNNGGNPGDGIQPGGNNGGDDTTPDDDLGFGDEDDIPEDPTVFAGNGCSAEDLNIVFTAEEITKLKALQTRFNTISATLYGPQAVNDQNAFYDKVGIKRDQIVDLKNFCNNNVSKIPSSSFARRVPTPFYHDSGRDSSTFTNYLSYFSDHNNGTPSNRKPILSHPENLISFFERLLRISIW